MWSPLVLLLIVGTVLGLNHAGPWEPNKQYTYQIHSRTYTGIPELRQQFAAVVSRGQLVLQTGTDNYLIGQLRNFEHGSYNGDVPNVYPADIPEDKLTYQLSNLNGKPFKIYHANGLIQRVDVDKSLTNDEVNQLKGILSQLQVNTQQGQNILSWPYNQYPSSQYGVASGLYRAIESSVTGQCEVAYEISPIASYAVPQSYPHWSQSQAMPQDSSVFQIVKTTNYTNCEQVRGYNYGTAGLNVNGNKIGQILSRKLVNRIVATGTPANFTIYYSQSDMRVSAAPELYQQQQAVTTSAVELYLIDTAQQQQAATLPPPNQPQNVGNLVYRYNIPSDRANQARVGDDNYNGQSLVHVHGNFHNNENVPNAGQSNNWYNHASDEDISSENDHNSHEHYSREKRSASSQQSVYDNFWQPYPSTQQPAENPFLPYYVGHRGHAIRYELDMPGQIQCISNEIAQLSQSYDEIPQQHVLEKYNILVDLVASANYNDIQQAVKNVIPNGHASFNVLRDAVVASGSGPATLALADWIASGQWNENEVIKAVVIQPKVVQTPTKDHFVAYMNLLKNKYVIDRPQVYSAILLTVTEIAGKVYTSSFFAKNYYPQASYGPFAYQLVETVENQILPYLQQSLKAAFDTNNDHDILVVIRAYGNLAHPSYFNVFKQYYERKEQPIPVFQRSAMIMAMDYLTISRREFVQPVLYKIYMNVAEHPDVRSTAVLMLIGSNPPLAILQQVAAFTNQDPSLQVQSVVKYSLETIAQLQSPKDQRHADNAKSAQKFLNPATYNSGYSHSVTYDHLLKNLNYIRHQHLSVFTSNDAPIPSMVRLSVFDSWGGMTRSYLSAAASVSNVGDLLKRFYWPVNYSQTDSNSGLNIVYTNSSMGQTSADGGLPPIPAPNQAINLLEQFQNIIFSQQYPSSASPAGPEFVPSQTPWSPVQMPNADNAEERLQGHSRHNYFGGIRYHAYDQNAIDNLPKYLNDVLSSYENGRAVNFTKFFKKDTLTVAFPLATGYPYVYTWDNPILVHSHGNVTVKTSSPVYDGKSPVVHIPKEITFSANAHVLYSANHITRSGFVTPFSGKHYIAGHVRRVMYNLPIYMQLNVNLVHQSLNGAFMPVGKANLAHFSSVPYTAERDAFSITPDTAANQRGVQVIQARPAKVVERKLGEETTGLILSVTGEYETPREIYGPIPYLVGGLPKSGLLEAFLQPSEGVEAYNIQVAYNDRNTKADGVRFGFSMKSGVVRNSKANVNSLLKYILSRKKRSPQQSQQSANYPQPSAESSGAPHTGVAFLQSVDELFETITPSLINGQATVASAWVALAGPATQTVYEAVGSYSESRPTGVRRFTAGFRRNELNYFNEKQYCLEANIKEPGNVYYATSSLDQAAKSNRQVGIQFRFTVGPDCVLGDMNPNNTELVGIAVLNQTQDYDHKVLNSEVARQCKEDSARGNYQSPACRRAIRNLRVPNAASFHIDHRGSDNYVHDILHLLAWPQTNPIVRNVIMGQQDIKPISGSFLLGRDSKYYDGTVYYGNDKYQVHDLEVTPLVRSVAFNEDVHEQLTYNKVLPRDSVCVVDNSQIVTFDGAMFNRSLGRCSYTVAQSYESNPNQAVLPPRPASNNHQVSVVMADQTGLKYGREAIINFYKDTQGVSYSLRIYGRGPGVRPIVVLWQGEETSALNPTQHTEVETDGIVRAHVYPQFSADDNVVVVDLHEGRMRIVFNGIWLRIEADASYRNKLRGLCGTNDLERYDDRQSPRHCVYYDMDHFVDSWANPEMLAFCHSDVKESVAQAQQASCYPIHYQTNQVVQSYESGTSGNSNGNKQESQQSNGNNNSRSHTSCQLRYQIQYVNYHGQVCFSTQPLATCPQHCNAGVKRQRVHNVPVRCYNNNDPRVRGHIQSINKGQNNLKWGANVVSKSLDFNVPQQCRSY